MSYPYATLSKSDLRTLRVERLRFLECEHARFALVLEENSKDPEARKNLADIEQRIALHRGILTPAPIEGDSSASGVPADEGSDALSRT